MLTPLPTASFGRTGFAATRLGFGAMELRGTRIWRGRPIADAEAGRILHAVLDAGVNFIDTSNDYGMSEEHIGRHIAGRRDEFFLATKCGCTVTRKDDATDETPHVWTRENLFRGLEESLKRMRTDRVDLIQLHNPKFDEVDRNGLVDALLEMKEKGMARHIGISTAHPALDRFLGLGVFEAFQIPYSALERKHETAISRSAKAGLGTIIRGGIAKGEPGAGMGKADRWDKFEEARLDELRDPGESRTTFLLRFTLSHPDIHTIIVGTLNPAHFEENLAAARKGPLLAATYSEARSRLSAVGLLPDPPVPASEEKTQ